MADVPADGARSPMPVPALLKDVAGWVWRILVVVFALVVLIRFMDRLYFIVLPFFAALFATSLGYPLVVWFTKRGLPRALATWITILIAVLVFGGIAVFVVDRAISQYSDLVAQVEAAVTKFRNFLTDDLHVRASSTASLERTITDYLRAHQSSIAQGALSGIATVAETLAGIVLWFFMTFFMLYDGHNIWNWFANLFPAGSRHRVHHAGEQAWSRLEGFVRGTFIIAVFHGIVVAITLWIMGVPLVAPLALLVFMGSFLPIIGAFLFGGLAVAVTFVTQGWVMGVVLIGVLVLDNQIEAHVFQPFLVGRYVELHPLAVAVAIAGGGVLEGVYGAVLAVPVVAVCFAVIKSLIETGAVDPDPPPPKRAPARKAPAKRAPAKKAPAAARPRASTAR
ncbi:MAG TPA: AI-2E family transporter [Mycobacteriales bacterium]|nr:AI-2E family transporter [Mycobacteriales bacterium]